MRTLWTGSISFGLVFIPIRLYSATESHTLDFDMLHKEDLSPIRYARVCKADGQEVAYEEIVKGYEYRKGDYVILENEDFEKAKSRVEQRDNIDIVSFVDEVDVDSVYYEKPYYLEPDKGADKVYSLLSQALKESGKVGIARYVLRNREHMAVIKPAGDMLVLNQIRFADEIRDAGSLHIPEAGKADKKEVEMAMALINQLAGDFEPEQYKDTYQEALLEIIEEKAEGKAPKAEKAPEVRPEKVRDIMSLLKASLEKEEKTKEEKAKQARKTEARSERKTAGKKRA